MDKSTSSPPSSGQSRRRRRDDGDDQEEFLLRFILPAIRGRSCPICLETPEDRRAAVITVCRHGFCVGCIRKWSNIRRNCPLCKAEFESLFSGIDLRRRRFSEERLPPLGGGRFSVGRSDVLNRYRRIARSVGDEVAGSRSRTRPLPWRRSFGRPGSVSPEVVAKNRLEWRRGIYFKRLQAIPLSSQSSQDMPRDPSSRERILNRIEPWIRRELLAILEAPDPSVIVHVVTSLFMKSVDTIKEDNPAASLRPFLNDWADIFWHELRCFAQSSLNMEAYDQVVEYRQFEER